MIFLLRAVGAITSLVVGGMATALVLAGSWLAFDGHGWLLDPVQPSLMALLVFVTAEGISYMHSETERRQVRGAFKQYLAPELVDQLARRPELLRLGGEQRTMTIMFCDVRGFTTISEHYKDDPQGLTALVNRLLTPMTDVVLGCRGTIDKYIGDCIMAFWNAPLDDLEHAANACRAAPGDACGDSQAERDPGRGERRPSPGAGAVGSKRSGRIEAAISPSCGGRRAPDLPRRNTRWAKPTGMVARPPPIRERPPIGSSARPSRAMRRPSAMSGCNTPKAAGSLPIRCAPRSG